MNVSRLVTSGLVLVVALGPGVARGQDSTTIRVTVHVPDSVAHVVDRERPDRARFAIVSRINSHEATDTIKSTANRIFARMVLGALTPLLDHGIAYHLRDLADARYADGRLLLLRSNGDEVFRDVEIGKGPLMESFSADDAKAFATKARAARAQLER